MKRACRFIVPALALITLASPAVGAVARIKPAPASSDFLYGVASGPADSLEYAVAGRIASLAALGQEGGPHGESGPRLVPLVEPSGRAALDDLLTQPSTDLAIVPAPLLDRAAADDPSLKKHVGYVAPLYLERVRVLVRPGVATVADLNGRRVAVDGADGVGAALLSDLGVAADLVLTSPADPAGAIRRGDVDAVVVTGGDPASGLGEVTGGGIALLPVPYGPALERDFVPVTLARSDIASLVPEAGLATVASPAVLAIYLRPQRSERAETLWSLVAGVLDHAGGPGEDAAARALADVNWAAELPGWRRLPAAEAWIDARRRAEGSPQTPIRTEDKR